MTTLNFKDIDRFREERLGIGPNDMAKVLGVSRMTYWRWVGGVKPQSKQLAKARERIVKLLDYVRVSQWPDQQVKELSKSQRAKKLLEEVNFDA